MSGEPISGQAEQAPVNGGNGATEDTAVTAAKETNGGGASGSIDTTEETRAAAKRAFLEVSGGDAAREKYKQFMLKPLETKKLKTSEALSRVKDFLPCFKQSTDKLLDEFKANPDELNIENVDDEDEHIEMNLALVSEDDDSGDDDDEDQDDDSIDEEEDSDEEDTSEEGEGDDDDDDTVTTKKPAKKKDAGDQYIDMGLGFKVKDPSKIEKLKLPTTSSKLGKKPLIQIIDQNDDDDDDDSDQEAK